MSIADKEVASLAFCWRVERKDGAGLALTSHDRALTVAGARYEPAPGMTPSAIRMELGLEPRSSEVAGALSSIAISETDILAGRWDGAALELFAVDWESGAEAAVELLSGTLGQVTARDGEFSVDLLGAATGLEGPVYPLTSPECRAELGDSNCRLDMSGRTIRAKVIEAAGHLLTVDQAIDERFRFGRIRFLGGPANGEVRVILAASDDQISLRSAPNGGVAPGTALDIVEGCDKRLETCAARFGNAENFRGEPHLPGNDLLTRYPGA